MSSAAMSGEEEEVEDVCRICRLPGYVDNSLSYPCACRGTIKFVHQACLIKWFNYSRFPGKCEVCKHVFSFSSIYAENAPTSLPLREFVSAMAMKACRFMLFVMRLSFVMSIWLLVIPFMTFWVWKFSFVRSFSEVQRLFLTEFSTRAILVNCLLGSLIDVTIAFIFYAATPMMGFGGHAVERERNAPRAQPNRNLPDDGIDQAGGRLEAHGDGLDGADGGEATTFYEFVGMQGPVLHLLERAFIILAICMTFLGVVISLPFSIGRLVIFYSSAILTSARGPLLSAVVPYTETACSLPHISSTDVSNLVLFGQDNGSLDQVSGMLERSMCGLNDISNQISTPLSACLMESSIVGATRLSNFTMLAIGYMFILSLAFLYIAIIDLIHYKKGEHLTIQSFFGSASIVETAAHIRQFLRSVKHLMSILKKAVLLMIGFGILPIICGCWLDVCIIAMFSKIMMPKVQFFLLSSFYRTITHFFLGVIYLDQMHMFFSILKKILNDEVLCFLPDSNVIDYDPSRDLDSPVRMHARRILLCVAFNGSLIVMIVLVPVKLVLQIFPSIFPLDLTATDLVAILPANMIIFQIFIPFAYKHFKLWAALQFLLRYWFTIVGWALGLTDFLRLRLEDNDARENINRDLGFGGLVRRQVLQFRGQDLAVAAFPDIGRGIPASESCNVENNYDGEGQFHSNYNFILRIVLLLVIAWMTMLLITSAVIVVPISSGRALLNTVHILPRDIRCNDLYTFSLGSFIIGNALAGATYSIQQIRARRTKVLASQIRKWLKIVSKISILLSIWAIVIPILIGFLVELLVLPILISADEILLLEISKKKILLFVLFPTWVWGSIFLQIWTSYVMEDPLMPFVDESLRTKFRRVKEDGFTRVRVFWILREIICPILIRLLLALCVPYVFARMFAMLGFSLKVNAAVGLFAWLGCFSFIFLCLCIKGCYTWFTKLYNSMHDDRYQIRRVLENFGEPV